MNESNTPKKLAGFAALPVERRREIARMGQAALIASGKRHTFTPEKAREAARVGWARRRGAA
jgi:hypothetical protein